MGKLYNIPMVGDALGFTVPFRVGCGLGSMVGPAVGSIDGDVDGEIVGSNEGIVGSAEGSVVGEYDIKLHDESTSVQLCHGDVCSILHESAYDWPHRISIFEAIVFVAVISTSFNPFRVNICMARKTV